MKLFWLLNCWEKNQCFIWQIKNSVIFLHQFYHVKMKGKRHTFQGKKKWFASSELQGKDDFSTSQSKSRRQDMASSKPGGLDLV